MNSNIDKDIRDMGKVRIGLIGVSGYGYNHFERIIRLVRLGVAEFSAAVVINPEEAAAQIGQLREFGARIYSSADAMFAELRGKLDLVCIPTGIAFHEPLTVQALENGANVLVEKPAAGSVAAIRRMMEAEKKSGKFVAVGFQHIYGREIQFLKQYLLTGRIGRVESIVCKGLWPRADQYYRRNNWAGRRAAADGTLIWDSPINNAFAHYLNLELFLAGERFGESAHAVEVEGALWRARKEIETFDTCAVRFTVSTGSRLTMLLSHATPVNLNPVIRIQCEHGTVFWNVDRGWNICSEDGAVIASGIVQPANDDMFMDVIRRISGEEQFLCSLPIAREHTNCIEMLSEKLQPVELKESVSRRESDGQYLIAGIPEVFDCCFARNRLPEEIGVVWR